MPTRSPTDEPPSPAASHATGDFRRRRSSGETPGVSGTIGSAICTARDAIARKLVRVGLTPNHLTVLGFLLTCAAGYCLARGAHQQVSYFYNGSGPLGWWPLAAAGFIFLAGALDMLDGAVARVGNLQTTFGAIFESSLDRLSDMAVYLGIALHFAWLGNLTYQLLAMLALCNAVLISYIKARAEDIIPDCSVGYWLRGERFAALLIACSCGHVPAVLWQQGILTFFTVWRRLTYSHQAAAALEAGRPPPPRLH